MLSALVSFTQLKNFLQENMPGIPKFGKRSRSPGSSSAPEAEISGLTASVAFKTAAESRIFVAYTEQQHAELKKIGEIFGKRNEAVEARAVNAANAATMLNVVERTSLPLVFIKGDCVGGLPELQQLEQWDVLDEWLKDHQYDLAVIGGGSGGLAASKEAARLGKKVICLDFVKPSLRGTTWGLGGTCVNVGCIPKKLMHQASLLGEYIEDARKFGWNIPEGDAKLDWQRLKEGVQDHIGSLNWGYRVQLREKTVTYLNSYAAFTGSHELTAKSKKGKLEKITADRFLIATGLRPRYPNIPGARECCISSDDLFSLPYNPGKTLCVGASYVSLECAGFLKGIGNDTTVMVRSILLRGFDQDMAERIRKHMIECGIKFIQAVPTKYERLKEPTGDKPGMVRVYTTQNLESGEVEEIHEDFDTVLMAIGRDAVTDDIGLDEMHVERSKAGKVVGRREQSRTCPYVYAIGDVLNGCPELTPVAIHAGRALMRRIISGTMELTEYNQVPSTVFTPLEYGCCGYAEEVAIEKFGKDDVVVYHNVFIPLEYSVPSRKESSHCYCKLICLKSKEDLVVGLHILAPSAGEIIQGFAISLKLGAKKVDFDRLIGIHPTMAENFTTLTLVKEVGQQLKATGC